MTIEYCRGRKTFGKPLIENQWIYFKLCELLTEVEFLRADVLPLRADHGPRRRLTPAKPRWPSSRPAAWCAQVADTCMQFHGGMGYMEEYPLARYFRDSRLMSIGAGADEIMLGIIAKFEGIAPPR